MTDHLTQPDSSPEPAADTGTFGLQLAGKYMTFKLAGEEYGLAILRVREIIGLMDITRVPRTRDFVRGVVNLRGKVIPVIDLRRKFHMPAAEATDQTVIIVVQWAIHNTVSTMGVLVDEVLEVLDIAAEQIEAPPELYSRDGETDFILGLGKSERGVICLLDIAKVLSREETAHLRSVEGSS